MRVLDLFSGIGGFSLGLEWAGMTTVAFCEIDDKCRQVLTKHWPDVPQYTDIKTLTAEQLRNDGIGPIDLICGGYPCQPFSTAGKRKGADDDRHLWPEFFRLVKELRPAWVIGENVAGHITMGLDSVLADLESESYACQPFVIPACAVGAYHRRDRVWIVANSTSERRREAREHSGGPPKRTTGSGQASIDVAHSDKEYVPGWFRGGAISENGSIPGERSARLQDLRNGRCWPTEPPVGRVATGVPGRVDRLKQLGNSVVPQIPEMIGRAILSA